MGLMYLCCSCLFSPFSKLIPIKLDTPGKLNAGFQHHSVKKKNTVQRANCCVYLAHLTLYHTVRTFNDPEKVAY